MDLFSQADSAVPELTQIPIDDGELSFTPQLSLPESNGNILAKLIADTPWRAEKITIYGKEYPQPRLTAVYGDSPYTYSGLTIHPLEWTPLLLEIKAAVELASGMKFNGVLLNYYRNERDSIGMHSDDEKELGRNPAVASVSFGATRTFILRHKGTMRSINVDLTDGCMLLMAGTMQHHWQHGINKTTRRVGERVNLTFRLFQP